MADNETYTNQQESGNKVWVKKRLGAKNPQAEMSFIDHLEALRWHIMRSAGVWLVLSVIIFIYIDWVFDNIITAPAQSNFISYRFFCNLGHWLHLGDSLCMPPVSMQLQGNTVNGPFMSAINIAMMGGLIVGFPYLFYELWRFIKPALSKREVRTARSSILWVSLCFFIGVAFGYFILAPFTFSFLANFNLGKAGVYLYRPSLQDYIDTLTNLLLGCGIAFELPIIALVLSHIGIINASFLKRSRKFAILIILILAAAITPSPDWTSQLIVAAPLLLLYEVSIILAARIDKKDKKQVQTWS